VDESKKTLKVGDAAPSFTLKNAAGVPVSLSDFGGKRVVLYFYPRDNTPGCTKEACAFQATLGKFAALNAQVIGVSADGETSHQKFAAKYNLEFPLLADVEAETAQKYGVWQEKNNYGKKYFGVVRTTFIIDENGRIARIFNRVKVEGHEEQTLKALAELMRAE
jgi:peroxiredoxin Q/BCP